MIDYAENPVGFAKKQTKKSTRISELENPIGFIKNK